MTNSSDLDELDELINFAFFCNNLDQGHKKVTYIKRLPGMILITQKIKIIVILFPKDQQSYSTLP